MWVATSKDMPGLVTETCTLGELSENLKTIIPELLEKNSHLVKRRDSPVVPQCL